MLYLESCVPFCVVSPDYSIPPSNTKLEIFHLTHIEKAVGVHGKPMHRIVIFPPALRVSFFSSALKLGTGQIAVALDIHCLSVHRKPTRSLREIQSNTKRKKNLKHEKHEKQTITIVIQYTISGETPSPHSDFCLDRA